MRQSKLKLKGNHFAIFKAVLQLVEFSSFACVARRYLVFTSVSAYLFIAGQAASAFTVADRDVAWSAWTNAYYYVASDGRGYIRVKEGNNSQVSFWQLAEEIEMVEDATCYASVQTNMVNALCAGFTNLYGVNWSWNTYNDDLMWASIAFSRAYLLTGNTRYRTLAKNGFDLGYSRGWDSTDGGIFQDTADSNPKCTCGNGSAAVAAYLLYQTLNDASYQTKAQGIYGWLVTNVFDPATGAVMEGPGTGNYFTYDSGMFATIALWLGDTNYAYKAGDWVTNHWGTGMQSFGSGSDGGGMNGICLRGLARTGHNIPALQVVCDDAWSWRNSRNLTRCDWYHRSPDDQSFYSNDTYSHIAGMLCLPTSAPPTLPATATDMVGGNVSFSAIFGGSYTYQWKVIQSGMTNNVTGATNTTLVLSNLQLTNAGSYLLQASNVTEIVTSVPSTLTVNSMLGATNNVVVRFAAQTGAGYGNWLTPTWVMAPGSVIQDQLPIIAAGNFDQETNWGDRVVNSLTAGSSLTVTPGGSSTTTSTNYVACGSSAGTTLIYSLTNGFPNGYSLTNITVYGGWKDAGRDQQAYTVSYSTISAPTSFVPLQSINFNPVNTASVPSTTRVTLAPASGYLAVNIAAVKFDFTSPPPENGFCGYAQIQLFGTPSASLSQTLFTFSTTQGSVTAGAPTGVDADAISMSLALGLTGPATVREVINCAATLGRFYNTNWAGFSVYGTAPNGNGTDPATAANFTNLGQYVFTLTADAGTVLNLNSLSYLGARGGSSYTRGFEVFADVNGVNDFNDDLVFYEPNMNTAYTRTSPHLYTFNLSSARYQGIGSVTIRYIPLTAGDSPTMEFNEFTVMGNIDTLTRPSITASHVSNGNLIITGTGGTPNSGYTWLQTTNLTPPISWTTNGAGSLDGTGSFSNAIPINSLKSEGFFRLRIP